MDRDVLGSRLLVLQGPHVGVLAIELLLPMALLLAACTILAFGILPVCMLP